MNLTSKPKQFCEWRPKKLLEMPWLKILLRQTETLMPLPPFSIVLSALFLLTLAPKRLSPLSTIARWPGLTTWTPVRDDPGPRADSPEQGLLHDGAQARHSPAPGTPDPVQRLPGALRRLLPHNAPGLREALPSLDGGRVLRGGAHRPGQGDIGWCSHSTHQGAEHPKLSVEVKQWNNLWVGIFQQPDGYSLI